MKPFRGGYSAALSLAIYTQTLAEKYCFSLISHSKVTLNTLAITIQTLFCVTDKIYSTFKSFCHKISILTCLLYEECTKH